MLCLFQSESMTRDSSNIFNDIYSLTLIKLINMLTKTSDLKNFQQAQPVLGVSIYKKYFRALSTTRKVLESSSSHGIPNILRAEKFSIKILWTIFTSIATALCGVLIIQSILNYLEFGVTTTIRIKNEISSIFPAITVCSLDPVLPLAKSFSNSANSTEQYLASLLVSQRKVDYSWNEFIYVCFFDAVPCANTSFKKFRDPSGSVCFTFNSGVDHSGKEVKALRSVKTGRIKGLSMHLNTWSFKQMFTGAYVYIHDQKTFPLSVEPVDIVPGEETTISIYKTISKQQPNPFSDCEYEQGKVLKTESDLVNAFNSTSYRYSQNLCLELCFHKIMLEQCECYSHLFSMFSEGRICREIDDVMCCWKEFHKFSNSNSISENCQQRCPLECETISYSKTVSRKKYLNNQELISLVIHFDGLGYTEIQESAIMNIVDLLSNIGGIAGLFLGTSLLSFVEILEIFLEKIIKKINNFLIQYAYCDTFILLTAFYNLADQKRIIDHVQIHLKDLKLNKKREFYRRKYSEKLFCLQVVILFHKMRFFGDKKTQNCFSLIECKNFNIDKKDEKTKGEKQERVERAVAETINVTVRG
ncbi:amiloride-sensitive sodium channel subunit beta, partial [Brachionus plicatilis]